MGRLQIQEYDKGLKEQFINGLNNETITAKIIKELTALKDMSGVISEQVLIWAQRVEAQKVQMVVLDNIKDAKAVCRSMQRQRQDQRSS